MTVCVCVCVLTHDTTFLSVVSIVTYYWVFEFGEVWVKVEHHTFRSSRQRYPSD